MATLENIVASWQKSNVQIQLNKLITAGPTGTGTLCFKNVGIGPWARQNRTVMDLGVQGTGGANSMRVLSDYRVSGVQRPSFPMELPFTPTALAFAVTSCLQNRPVYATTGIKPAPYTDPQAKLFFAMETTYGAFLGRDVRGGIVKTVKISIPPAGADGGTPTLSVDCLAAEADQSSEIVLTPAALDTAAPCQSTNWNMEYGTNGGTTVAWPLCGADITIDNGAELDPQITSDGKPLAYHLGELKITGSFKTVMTTVNNEQYDRQLEDFLNGTSEEIKLNWGTNGAVAYLRIPIMLEEPSAPETMGNIMTFTTPFRGIYVGAGEPETFFASMATPLTIWA